VSEKRAIQSWASADRRGKAEDEDLEDWHPLGALI
jgi:hypothetical protein